MKKILIRADGGKNIGLGHIMRMLVLAKELRKSCKIVFLCKNNESNKYISGINKIKENEFCVRTIRESRSVEDIIQIQKEEGADLLITDSYDVNEEYFDLMKKYFYKTAYIDDVNICRINADIIINQNINAIDYKYNTYPNKDTKIFLGTEYLLLREEFRHFEKRHLNKEVKNIILTVGGMDDRYLTLKIIKSISEFDVNIHVIIGNAFEKSLVDKILETKTDKARIILYKNAVMSDVMKKCDLAISGCGTTLYELGAMKVPIVGIVIADNQEKIANFMSKKNMIVNTDKLIFLDEKKFKEKIKMVINNYELRKAISDNLSKNINVKGAIKLNNEILKILK